MKTSVLATIVCVVLATAIIHWRPKEQEAPPLAPTTTTAAVLVEPAICWQVLAPRHRGTSPVPLTVLFTPGWLGPVEVRIETPRGCHATVTPARGIPWPQALPPLRVGDWCAVTIKGPHGRTAEAACVRVPLPKLEAGMGEPDFLDLGLPALAILRGGADLPVASLRAGVTEVPERGASATMARAREW